MAGRGYLLLRAFGSALLQRAGNSATSAVPSSTRSGGVPAVACLNSLFRNGGGNSGSLFGDAQQVRGYPTQRHQKILAANQKRNRLRKQMKQQEVKVSFVDAKKAELRKTTLKSKRYSPPDWQLTWTEANDDVYLQKYYHLHRHSLEECVLMHREIMHPTMLDRTNNLLMASVELNMLTKKKNKNIERFEGTLLYPHPFEFKGRITKILCFCRSADEATQAMDRGADLAGGAQLVKRVLSGEVDASLFDHVLCSIDMLDEISPLRQLLKKKMPGADRANSVSADPVTLVEQFRRAVNFEVVGDVHEPDFATFAVPLARLDMSIDHIAANLQQLYNEVNSHMPKGRPANSFITEVFLASPPSEERFLLDQTPFLVEATGGHKDSDGRGSKKKGNKQTTQEDNDENDEDETSNKEAVRA